MEGRWKHHLTNEHLKEEFENTALFLPLGLPSVLTRHRNGVSQNRFSEQMNLRTPA